MSHNDASRVDPVLAVDKGSAVSGANEESPTSRSSPASAVAVAPHPPGMTTERLAELRKMSAGLFEDSRLGSMSFGTAERLENAFADLFREIDRLRLDAARLDWLEAQGQVYTQWVDYECVHAFEWIAATAMRPDAPALRDAIDAARAAAALREAPGHELR